jgi:hypothetical protein
MLSLQKAVACEDADLGSLPHDNECVGLNWGAPRTTETWGKSRVGTAGGSCLWHVNIRSAPY